MKTNGELKGPQFAQKETKFMVLKLEDIKKYLDFKEQHKLEMMCIKIEQGRLDDDKETTDPKYIICNQDEPYAEVVWQVILYGENMKVKKETPTIQCTDCGIEKCGIKTLKLEGKTFPRLCRSYFKKVTTDG
jgi:hypothetical protein